MSAAQVGTDHGACVPWGEFAAQAPALAELAPVGAQLGRVLAVDKWGVPRLLPVT